MKTVTLKSIALTNFKGIRSLTVDFGGQATEIRGANATGKSTIADAFSWLLFGKDAAGNSDSKFGIKTVDAAGSVIPKLDHEVRATLDVNGEPVELARYLREDWVTPRGVAEPVLKGNTTSYFYNGVPLKESEYKEKVGGIISEDLFRLITNPHRFPSLGWEEQRQILLMLAGRVTLSDVAAGRPEFTALIEYLFGKTLAEYRAEIAARKKKLKEALEHIPARLDEVARATPAAPDVAALEAEKSALERELADVEAALQSAAEAARQEGKALREMQEKVNALKREQQQLIHDAKAAAQEAAFAGSAARRNLEYEVKVSTSEVERLQKSVEQQAKEKQAIEARLAERQKRVESLRQAWAVENAKEYAGDDSCPRCGQPLPEEMKANARELFEATKRAALAAISEQGREAAEKAAATEKEAAEASEKLLDLARQLEEAEEKLPQLDEALKRLPEPAAAQEVNPDSLPGYAPLSAQIADLERAISDRPADPDTSALAAHRGSLAEHIAKISRKLDVRADIEACHARREQLLKEERSLAQQKAELEGQEFTAAELVKAQMEEVERRVNALFTRVKFKMFTAQINGGEKPDCVMYSTTDGAKYMDMNSAQKVNAGLEIISVLCAHNAAYAPIFIDNAESVNSLIPVTSQLIKLVVTDDKKLTVSHD
jgi:DNA repair exonuclease SbcCD ATPase subunit